MKKFSMIFAILATIALMFTGCPTPGGGGGGIDLPTIFEDGAWAGSLGEVGVADIASEEPLEGDLVIGTGGFGVEWANPVDFSEYDIINITFDAAATTPTLILASLDEEATKAAAEAADEGDEVDNVVTSSNPIIGALIADSDNVYKFNFKSAFTDAESLETIIGFSLTATPTTLKVTKIELAVVEADTTAPVLSSGNATRTADETATVTFTSSEAGTGFYLVQSEAVAAPDAAAVKASGNTIDSITAGSNTMSLTGLPTGALKIYIIAKDAAGNESEILPIVIAAYVPPVSVSLAAERVDTGFTTATITLLFRDKSVDPALISIPGLAKENITMTYDGGGATLTVTALAPTPDGDDGVVEGNYKATVTGVTKSGKVNVEVTGINGYDIDDATVFVHFRGGMPAPTDFTIESAVYDGDPLDADAIALLISGKSTGAITVTGIYAAADTALATDLVTVTNAGEYTVKFDVAMATMGDTTDGYDAAEDLTIEFEIEKAESKIRAVLAGDTTTGLSIVVNYDESDLTDIAIVDGVAYVWEVYDYDVEDWVVIVGEEDDTLADTVIELGEFYRVTISFTNYEDVVTDSIEAVDPAVCECEGTAASDADCALFGLTEAEVTTEVCTCLDLDDGCDCEVCLAVGDGT